VAAAAGSTSTACLYLENSYTCVAPPPCTTCTDAPRTICSAGQIVDPTVAVTCMVAGTTCKQVVSCKADPCYTASPCECQYSNGCTFIPSSSASAIIGTCVSAANSDTAAVVATPGLTAAPDSCATQSATATTPSDKITATVSSASNLDTALSNFAAAVTTLQNEVDPTTGVKIAAQVSIVVLGVATPSKNADGSYTFAITVTFIPSDPSVTVTDQHRALYCPPLKQLIADITRVTVTSDCTYTLLSSTKRSALQTGDQTYSMTTTAPGSSVDSVYGSGSSTIVVAFGVALISLFVTLFM